MRGIGLLLCIIGVFIAAGGAMAYVSDRDGVGIAGMVVGAGLLGTGVMMFLTDFLLRLANRSANLFIRFRFFRLELVLRGRLKGRGEELEMLEDTSEDSKEARWDD